MPSEEQMELWPDVAGNVINGAGETERRNPSPVMWHPAEMIAHSAVQKWFWGCAMCLGVCPWTKPGSATTISETMLRRRSRQVTPEL